MGQLISVIVPVYNIEAYLSKCISSILQQTYRNIHIVLVDDGSTDNSGQICDDFAKRDDRIEVVHKENEGVVSARKAGLFAAKGQFIGFVDGDDYIDRHMYGRMLDNLIYTKSDFVHTGYYKGQMTVSLLDDKVVDLQQNKGSLINHYILSSNSQEYMSSSIWSKLFKANFLRECFMEIPDGFLMGEDLVNLILCILKGTKMSIMDSCYYYYRVRKTSIMHEKNDMVFLETVKLFQVVENVLKKYGCYDEVKDTLIKDWLRRCACAALAQSSYDEFKIQCYGFNNMQMLFGKKIVIYGAGKIGRDYYSQICRYRKCEIVAWIDKNYQNIHYDCFKVESPELLEYLEFDILIIAVKYEKNAAEIKNSLIREVGVEEAKILWIKPNVNG